ncbi:hypothetical protein PHLGIDRAFT_26518 [Phlebiopsis gigantea 11061_1 CR5-6]|uniref:Methyltransferase domain-containing protein n=1 Tax=Phlebiopsis gigantea (strain 11061_1 CR5-6) TaxID=745531 RepID=A0A0C3NDG2_PHLG1|nr:hypothetical protein PHLGIDRAFT_26518 [Phlebiopsis gigantea 11061_1 CR5-6]
MSVLTRHPRYAVFLLCILLGTLFVLTTPTVPPNGFRPSATRRFLHEEDLRYRDTLRGREWLVRKWGPTDAGVEPFPDPTSGEFYTLWDFFLPSFRCPHRVERIGTLGDGGKWVCGLERLAAQPARPCTIYSFGLNGESSFEAALLERLPHCSVFGYDFSVAGFGPEVANASASAARAHFFPYALAGADRPYAQPPAYTLQALMDANGHDFVDGAPRHPHARRPAPPVLPVGQLQLEIHAWGEHGASFAAFRKWWERLEAAGLRPFHAEPNLVYVNLVRGARPDLAEYSFMNIRGDHALVN